MNTLFKINDQVRSSVTAQGLEAGHIYTVTEVHSDPTPFGTFVTYVLDDRLPVVNGHLLLEPVSDQ